MSGFLADTNVPSELTRRVPDARVAAFLRDAAKKQVFLSVMTLGEMQKGVASLSDGDRRKRLEEWIENRLRPWFASRLLLVTEGIAKRWGLLAAEAKLRGAGLSVVDGLIAATALEHDLTLVTRNGKDFSQTGVKIFNLWEG